MGSPRRYEEAGAIQHAFAHAIADSLLFVEPFDYDEYVRLLERTAAKYNWQVMSYCLMSNHMHLLIRTTEPNLGAGMRYLHSRYALGFNQRHGKCGARFRARYGSRRVMTDENFAAVVRYIPMNPVNAGICLRPEDYEWSSHGSLVRGEAPAWMGHAEMLRLLGTIESYARIVSSGS